MKCGPRELEGWGLHWESDGFSASSDLLIQGVVASFGLWPDNLGVVARKTIGY